MLKKPYSILVVEDEDIIRTSLREFLSEEGYEVGVAASVASALHQARQRDFDVAICDVQLPDGDGLVLLRRLQQLNPNISGLMISATRRSKMPSKPSSRGHLIFSSSQ